MQLLFRLPFLLLETVLRQGLSGVAALARLVRGETDDMTVAPTAAPPEPPEPSRSFTGESAGPTPPTAEEAIERRFAREEAAAPRPEPTLTPEPTPVTDAPSRRRRNGTSPAPRHVDREATVVESVGPAEDVRGTLTVEAPWEGYDDMPAGAIIARLRDADDTTRAMVRLYEGTHKNRATVVRATG